MYKSAAALALIFLVGCAYASEQVTENTWMEQHLNEGFDILEHKFEATHFHRDVQGGSESIVYFPEGGLFTKPEHQDNLREVWLDAVKNPQNYKLEACDESTPSYFKFAPYTIGMLKEDGQTVEYTTDCYKKATVTLKIIDNSTVELVHVLSDKKSLTCGDGYLYSSLFNYHVSAQYIAGKHSVKFKKISEKEMELIKTQGMAVFRTCDKILNLLPDMLKTVYLFLGGLGLDPNIPFIGSKPTKFQIEQNIKFIKDATGYQWEKRPEAAQKTVYNLDPKLIRSGDFLAITRFDGLDQIIEYGAGSHAGHSTMALWVDNELYIVESQAGWYWPRQGLQMNPFSEWVKWAHDADFQVTWLPLKKEIADKFDERAAYEWFKTVEGMPYGFHNFMFGWIDTPDHSYPPLLDPDAVAVLFAIVEKISPVSAREMFTLAMNKRLNTTNLTIGELGVEAARQNKTFPDLYAMVEQDGWWYPDGYSYVCSSFVVALWKAAGLFEGMEINAVEFTPRDVYQMTYIDPAPTIPDSCKALDPQNKYCQIMGTYRMTFEGISTVPPYSHMNEHCQSEPPNYPRIPSGC